MSHGPRFSEIRNLVSGCDGLTLEESRYLKFLLVDFHTDLIAELPLEIVTMIALDLRPKDFAHCLKVSKTWRERFLSAAVMLAYARQRWPAMITSSVTRPDFLYSLFRLGFVYSNYHLRLDFSNSDYPLDPVFINRFGQPPAFYKYIPWGRGFTTYSMGLYAYGKVALHPYTGIITVDDLRVKTRKVMAAPSAPTGSLPPWELRLLSLGSKLVIASQNKQLVAWDHVENEVYEKPLHCRVHRVATHDMTVAAVLCGGDVVLWTPGHAAIQLDMSRLTKELGLDSSQAKDWEWNRHVFFDHRNSKTLYLASSYDVYADDNSSNGAIAVRATVHKFSEGIYISSWNFDHEYFKSSRPSDCKSRNILISEYELEFSCIFFSQSTPSNPPEHFVAFDKIQQKFFSVTDLQQSNAFARAFAWSGRNETKQTLDLDFQVSFFGCDYEATHVWPPATIGNTEDCPDPNGKENET
ncbi:hypothetical protein F4808DRAFT_409844 [Astrocystis sublimbata]|nr:hypothetical protein F4808DRAFT_409844 [Astrocystis sublimbata]